MNHPLTGNLRDLSDGELLKKITDLQKRMVFAHSSGHGQVLGQIEMMLDDYRGEQQRRDIERYEKLNNANKDKGKNWDDLIDI